MSRVRTRVSVAFAAVCWLTAGVFAPAVQAAGDTAGRIDHVETSDGSVELLYSVPGLSKGVSPDAGTIKVAVNGQPMPAQASEVEGSQAVRRTAVLAIDVSKSMSGRPFAAAKAAAISYIDQAPDDVYISVVTFASAVETVQEPTLDHGALTDAVNSLELSPETRLYDGVLQALDVTDDAGSWNILLLSDGKDTSDTDLGTVVGEAKAVKVPIDVIALNQRLEANSPLQQIADATDGSVTSTFDLKELQAFFESQADVLSKQLLVTFDLPAGYSSEEGDLQVSVQAGGRTYSDEAFVSLAGSAPAESGPIYAPAPASGHTVGKTWFFGGIASLFIGLVVLLGLTMTKLAPAPESPLQQQLALYTAQGMRRAEAMTSADDGTPLKESAVKLAAQLMDKRDLEEALATKLDAGGISLKPAEWMLLHVGIAIGGGVFGMLISGGSLLVTILFLVFGLVLPWLYLSFKESRRLKKFNSQLAQTLQIMAGGLQAGLSLPQAVDTVVQDGSEPVSGEFNRALVEQRLGVDIEDALETVAERMQSVDFKWVVMAIRIQREVGGNLSELLLTVAATLREREYLRRQVAVLSAEGRLSAWILGGLPPVFVAYLAMARPTYLAPMLHSQLGWVMSGAAAVMMAVGVFWLKKTVKVEV